MKPAVAALCLVTIGLLTTGGSGDARQLAARPAEEWIKRLDAPERIARLKVDEIVAALRLQSGDVVADLGAGTGVFSLAMARRVGAGGKVYAVEIEQGLVDHMTRKAAEQGVANVRPVLGRFTDPALPARDVDVAFMHDVLHHIEAPQAYLGNTVKYLEPSARFAFVEFHHHLGPHKNDPKLGVGKGELDAWMTALGFALVEEIRLFEDQYFVIYARKR
jgi:ubiquinone/menaquinone biosynthesis C-methylase UbiE